MDNDPADPGQGDPAPQETGSGTAPEKSEGTDAPKSEGRTFTQDEVNALITREVSKAKRGKIGPEELGFDSRKELEDALAAAKQLAENEKTEHERAVEAARKEERDRVTGEIMPVVNQRIIRAEFLVSAKDAGITYPKDAYALAQTMDEWANVAVDDQGVVAGLDEDFFKQLKEAKPFLVSETKSAGAGDIGAGAAGGGSGDQAKDREVIEKYPLLRRLTAANKRG